MCSHASPCRCRSLFPNRDAECDQGGMAGRGAVVITLLAQHAHLRGGHAARRGSLSFR